MLTLVSRILIISTGSLAQVLAPGNETCDEWKNASAAISYLSGLPATFRKMLFNSNGT